MLSVKDVAKELRVCTRTIYRFIKDKKLKAVKLGHILRIREEDFEEFIRPKGE